jgi:hypothetical protein
MDGDGLWVDPTINPFLFLGVPWLSFWFWECSAVLAESADEGQHFFGKIFRDDRGKDLPTKHAKYTKVVTLESLNHVGQAHVIG